MAAENDMMIACESLRPQESLIGWRIDQIKHLFDEVNHPNFKVMIDLTAMSVAGETIQQWLILSGLKILFTVIFRIVILMDILCGEMETVISNKIFWIC